MNAHAENLAFLHVRQILTMAGPNRPRTGQELDNPGLLEDGTLLLRDGVIEAVGPSGTLENRARSGDYRLLDLSGRDFVILPGFVDSHTHPAFHGTREDEYEMRIRGLSYAEIAAQGGGILNSAKRVAGATQEQIQDNILRFCPMFLDHGTTTIEAKSGYGLSLDGELKLLRAISEASRSTLLDLVPTFLGAHAYPACYRDNHEPYLVELIDRMLPAIAEEGLARFCDSFCDQGFFSVEETRRLLQAAAHYGMRPKIHADELAWVGGAELAAEMGAASADHLEKISGEGMRAMARASVVAGLLPGTAFNLGLPEYPPARDMIEAGVPVAVATDFNPGSCFNLNMQLAVSIACAQMRLTPAEALCAATINGAWALGLGQDRGSLEPGKRADVAVMACSSYRMIPYFFGVNHCVETLCQGVPIHGLKRLTE